MCVPVVSFDPPTQYFIIVIMNQFSPQIGQHAPGGVVISPEVQLSVGHVICCRYNIIS